MSRITLSGNASGTGNFTLASPNSSTDRTLTLPDATGTLFGQGNIVGTVSQSGGVPTGAIIEQGSNANGSYIKFADGTLICTHSYQAGNATTITSFGTFTFPATFSSLTGLSFVCRAATSGSPAPYVYFYTEPTTTTYIPLVASSGIYTLFLMTAVGRWF
jgi:hypothetical protein